MILFSRKRARRAAAEDVKNMIRAQIAGYKLKQRLHKNGSDYWNRYQLKISALSDLKDTINETFF